MGVGLLTFFIAPNYEKTGWLGSWGVMNVSSLALAAVGGVHTFRVCQAIAIRLSHAHDLRGRGWCRASDAASRPLAHGGVAIGAARSPCSQSCALWLHPHEYRHALFPRPMALRLPSPTRAYPPLAAGAGGGGEAGSQSRGGRRRAASDGRAGLQLTDGLQLALPCRQGGLMRRRRPRGGC